MKFGDCLLQLLDEYAMKRSDFVRNLSQRGVDASLLYRWLRNERTPKLNSPYLDLISLTLGLKPADRARLRQAQVDSLQVPISTRKPGLGGDGPPVSPEGRLLQEPFNGRGHSTSIDATALPIGNAVWGSAAVHEAVATLLRSAPNPPVPGQNEILLTALSDGPAGRDDWPVTHWAIEFRWAMDRGYDICHLIRVGGTQRRSMYLAEKCLRLMRGTGVYRPRRFLLYDVACSYDMLIVPGSGAMLFLSTKDITALDAALIFTDPLAIDTLRAHFLALRNDTEPLLKATPSAERGPQGFLALLSEVDSRDGDSYICSPGLGLHTRPYVWYSDGATGPAAGGSGEAGLIRELERRRLDAFYRQLRDYRFLEIYPRSAVLRLARDGEGSLPGFPLATDMQQRLAQIEHLIALIRSFDKLEIALVSEKEERLLLTPDFWQVKQDEAGDHRVLMGMRSLNLDGTEQRSLCQLADPALSSGFRDYFQELFYHRIGSTSRDKREVILFLESQAQWLQERIPQGSQAR